MKILFVLSSISLIAACGKVDQMKAHYTGEPARVCVAGVTYLQFTTGATVMLDKDGKVVSCK